MIALSAHTMFRIINYTTLCGVNCSFCSYHVPLDSPLGRILTVEDHGVVGGLGSAVLDVLADVPDVIVHVHGVRGYGESGTHEDLYARHRLDAAGIAAVAKERLWAKKPTKAAS